MNLHMPDPQHLELDALRELAHELEDRGQLNPSAHGREPESVVFTESDFDGFIDYDAIQLVGERDVANKIAHWRKYCQEGIETPPNTYTAEDYTEAAHDQAMMAMERRMGC